MGAFNASFTRGPQGQQRPKKKWTPGQGYGAGSTATFESTAGNPGEFREFDKTVLGTPFQADQGTYDQFTDAAYGQATRLLDPQFDRARKDFEQRAVNRGFTPGTEAYNTALDQFTRQQNDAYNQAAFGALDYGSRRLDADRQMSEAARQFDAGLQEGARMGDNTLLEQKRAQMAADATNRYGISTGARTAAAALKEQGRQFDKNFGLEEMLGIEGVMGGYRDDAYRDAVFNATQDQQQFNNLFQMQGLVPGAAFSPTNPGNAFNNAMTADLYNDRNNRALYGAIGQGVSDLATNIDWSNLFSGGSQANQNAGNMGWNPNVLNQYT